MSYIYILFLCLMLLPTVAFSVPTITCHCFTERTFDAGQPAKSDPYLLATVQNTFLAVLFKVDKTSIVLSKQRGISSSNLWLAHWLAVKSGKKADAMLASIGKGNSWRETEPLAGFNRSARIKRIFADMKGGVTVEMLAWLMVDEALLSSNMVSERDIADLRSQQATNQEMIIAALVAKKLAGTPIKFLADVRSGRTSWGILFNEAKLTPGKLASDFEILIK